MPNPTRSERLSRSRPWLAGAAVLLPLAVLLALQWRALVNLEETSAAAHYMTLRGIAKSILRNAESFYVRKADALALSPGLLAPERAADLAARLAPAHGPGVKLLFVMRFDGSGGEEVSFWDADGRAMTEPPDPATERAVNVAAAPARLVARERTAFESSRVVVDQQDPANRVVLRPVAASGHVIGAAGFVVDEGYFRAELLPRLIEEQTADVPDPLRGNVIVSVRDGGGRYVVGSPRSESTGEEISPRFRFVFDDWTLGVRTRSFSPEEWARWSFGINLSLSLLATGALVAAIVVALRSAARATRLSRMKTEFVSNVSHELRTPLSSIRVFGEFLRLGRVTEPDKLREYGEYIEAESARLTSLVDNILDFSKIESAEKRYRMEKVEVAEIVAETLKALDVRLRQAGFAVDVRAGTEPAPPILADPGAISQALTNLLDNAVKYSGEARSIDVEVGRSNGFATISIRDRGPGIPAEDHERIFEKFYRVSAGLVHDARGSGLGLAIVKHIVEAHRGRIALESRPGEGSRFTIELPAAEG